MSAPELSLPVSSGDSIPAVVQNGADAIYIDLSLIFSPKRAVFTAQSLAESISYCRLRGVKVYIDLTGDVRGNYFDEELPGLAEMVRSVGHAGADAVRVCDLGVARMVRMIAPGLPVHFAAGMGMYNLDSVRQAESVGCTRVDLPCELGRDRIAYICSLTEMECSVQIHGPMCASHRGQCHMSLRSGKGGLCLNACRQQYSCQGSSGEFPLSIKDCSLLAHIFELTKVGVRGLRIEGQWSKPEMAAIVTRLYSEVIYGGIGEEVWGTGLSLPSFGGVECTDAYYTGEPANMLANPVSPEERQIDRPFSADAHPGRYELGRVEITIYCMIKADGPVMLALEDPEGRVVKNEGEPAEKIPEAESAEQQIRELLSAIVVVPYRCKEVKLYIESGLTASPEELFKQIFELYEQLTNERMKLPEREFSQFRTGLRYLERREPPVHTVALHSLTQLSPELLALSPERLYLPLKEAVKDSGKMRMITESGVIPAVVLPHVLYDDEYAVVRNMLETLREWGVTEALAANLGMIAFARNMEFTVRADFGMNVCNSLALREIKRFGVVSAALSYGITFDQIRALSKAVDVEFLAYGRVPLMLMENCIDPGRSAAQESSGTATLTDARRVPYPVVGTFGDRSLILSPQKVFLADRSKDYRRMGLWAARLSFTTENARECVQVLERYKGIGKYQPNEITRSRYYD